MSLSGPQVLGALEDALRDIRGEEDDILRKLSRTAERIAKIETAEAELLRELAAGRLPAEKAGLPDVVAAAATKTQALVDEHTDEIGAAAERMAALDAEHAALTAQRSAALSAIDHQQGALRGLSSRIASAIERDPAYERYQQQATRLRAVAAAARAKAREADAEREQQTRPYRSDPLFSYLMRRQYGTSEYRGRGLVARLDAWVASLVDFGVTRRRYETLADWPSRLHAHAAQQAANAVAADEAIDEIERNAIDAAGGGTVRTALAEAQGRIAEIDGRLADLQAERDALTEVRTVLAKVDGLVFDKAVAALVGALGSPDVSALVLSERAAASSGERSLVAQFDDARLRLEEERTDTQDQHLRLATLADRRRALENLVNSLKSLRFDDPRSLFRDDNLTGSELDAFLTGALSAEGYANSFRRSHGWMAGTAEWGGGVGLPRRGRQHAEAPPPAPEPEVPQRTAAGAAE